MAPEKKYSEQSISDSLSISAYGPHMYSHLWAWSLRTEMIAALEHSRPNVTSYHGGPVAYIQHGELPDFQIESFKGNFAEEVRNRYIPGSEMEKRPEHPYADRHEHGMSVQDTTTDSVPNFLQKYQADGRATKFHGNDALQQNLEHYQGPKHEIVHQALDRLDTDWDKIGIWTDSDWWEKMTREVREKISHPVYEFTHDFGEYSIETMALYACVQLVATMAATGTLDSKQVSRVMYNVPSYMPRYLVVTSGSHFIVMHRVAETMGIPWVNQHLDVLYAGSAFALSTAWNTGLLLMGKIPEYQFRRNAFAHASTTTAFLGTKILVIAAGKPTLATAVNTVLGFGAKGAKAGSTGGPKGAIIGFVAAMIVSGAFLYRNYRRTMKYYASRLNTLIDHEISRRSSIIPLGGYFAM